MSGRTSPDAALSALPTDAPAAPARVDELRVAPVEGMPRWLGRILARLALRAASMEEQPETSMSGALSPVRGYFRRDRHVHPRVDAERWRLRVTGVATPSTFDRAALADLPQEERVCVQECAGNGNHMMGSAGLIGQARWRGPSLERVLERCGGPGPATHFAFRGLDSIAWLRRGYHYGLSLDELVRARAILALTMNGEPLSRRHGFPCRLIVPRIYSMSHVKWLAHIEGKVEPHRGIHNEWVFVNKELRDGKWVKVQARWIGLKSMVTRCVRNGDGWELLGWAWGGSSALARVEVSTDGGRSFTLATLEDARLDPSLHDLPPEAFGGAWATFRCPWRPGPGVHRVASRAFDVEGHAQPLEPPPAIRGHFDQCHVKWRRIVVP
jgi:DMSO/TMAO reductase YedYZ molybdopterin-dependent catalytic subunit